MKLSLVIPCYNEAMNLPLLLKRCEGLRGKDIEVILVDNGSSDDTQAVLNGLIPDYPFCRSVSVRTNQGYGHGILTGLRAATGDILGWTHADMQTDPCDVLQGMGFFEKNRHSFVKGRRYGRPLTDVVFTIGMSVLESFLLRYRFWDINAQPTLFPREFFEAWRDPPDDFSLDLYAYYMAHRDILKIERFPVRFGPRAYGSSHWNSGWKSRYKFIKRTLSFSYKLYRRTRNKSPSQ